MVIDAHAPGYLLQSELHRSELGDAFLKRMARARDVQSVSCVASSGEHLTTEVLVRFRDPGQSPDSARYLLPGARACVTPTLSEDELFFDVGDNRPRLRSLCAAVQGQVKGGVFRAAVLTSARRLKPCNFRQGPVRVLKTSGWGALSPVQKTTVCAGVVAGYPSVGALLIERQRGPRRRNVIKLRGTGAITLTHGPEGIAAALRAQRRGHLRFITKSGVRGALNLRDDSITLRRRSLRNRRVIEGVGPRSQVSR